MWGAVTLLEPGGLSGAAMKWEQWFCGQDDGTDVRQAVRGGPGVCHAAWCPTRWQPLEQACGVSCVLVNVGGGPFGSGAPLHGAPLGRGLPATSQQHDLAQLATAHGTHEFRWLHTATLSEGTSTTVRDAKGTGG